MSQLGFYSSKQIEQLASEIAGKIGASVRVSDFGISYIVYSKYLLRRILGLGKFHDRVNVFGYSLSGDRDVVVSFIDKNLQRNPKVSELLNRKAWKKN